MPKLPTRNVVHLVVSIMLLVTWQGLSAQELLRETVSYANRSLDAVAGKLLVRMSARRNIDEIRTILPVGFAVDGQFLPPERTVHFSNANRIPLPDRDSKVQQARPRVDPELRDSEDRLTRTFTVSYSGFRNLSAASARLRKELGSEIEIIEPWIIDQIQSAPTDPLLSQQEYLRTIRFLETWDVFRGSDSVVIAISDDGVAQDHEDLTANIAANTQEIPDNGVDDDANGYIDDYRGYNFTWQMESGQPGNTTSLSPFGHGTRVAGLAAAATNNAKGIASAGMLCRFFPIKVALISGGGILFGYQSLLYAAERGIPVVNASWGVVKPASAIDQSVIDFCLAKNTLVVASAGNHGDGVPGASFNERNYPASYDGVLGVGETTPDDFVIATSGLGSNSQIMAPGNLAITTTADGDYSSSGVSGTSFASPLAAGAAAVVRARWPQLTARQVMAHIRRTADVITSTNNSVAEVIAPRLNLYRAVTTEPLSQPALRIHSVRQSVSSGRLPTRFRSGDTLLLEFAMTNDLGSAAAEIEPRIISSNGWTLRGLLERDALGVVSTGETVWSKPFPFVVDAIGTEPCVMRVDILGESFEDHDFHYLELPAPIARFENDSLLYSMSDDGMVGYTSIEATRQGGGFAKKPALQLMSPGGFFMIEGADRSVTGFKNNVPFASDFAAVKSFDQDPLPAQCRMVDELAQTPIGVEVTQSCTFPRPDKASTVWTVSVTPRSRFLSRLAAGYLLDWDIGSGGRLNRISPDDEAIPADLRGGNVAAHRITRQGFPVSICVAVVSSDRDDRAQSACMLYGTFIDDGDGFSHSDMVRFLTSGTTIVESGQGDVCGVIGMSRGLPLDVGQTWTFSVIIAVGNDVEQARSVMRETLPTVGVTSDELAGIDQRIVPNPVTELATVRGTGQAGRCAVIDVLGRERLVWTHSSGGDVTFDVSSLEKGAYTLRIQDASTRQTRHLRFLR